MTAQDGTPVSGVEVSLLSGPTAEAAGPVLTDADGGYTIPDVADGTYRVQFLPAEGASVPDLAPQYFDGAASWDEAVDVVVQGSPVEQVDATLTPAVVDAASDAPTDAATDAPSDAPSDAATDVPSDPATDLASDPATDAATDAPTDPATDAATDPETGAPTDPETGAPTDPATDAPTDAPTDPATDAPTDAATDAPTDPATDAPTESTPALPSSPSSELPSAEVSVDPPVDPSGDPSVDPSVDPSEAAGKEPSPVTVVPELLALPLLADAAAGTISGTITAAADDGPVAYAYIAAYVGTESYPGGPLSWSYSQGTYSGIDGTYAFVDLAEGSYKLLVTPQYGSELAETWLGGATESAATELVLAGGVGLAAQDVALPTGARISGTVKGGSPLAPIENATVEIRRDWGGGYQTRAWPSTDAQGAFSAVGLPAGDYRIYVTAPSGSTWISTWLGGATQDSATVFPLALGDEQKDADVVLFQGGGIAGTVTGGGAPVSSAAVTAVRVVGTETQDVATAYTQADGTYTISGLASGTYRVRVSGPYQSDWLTTWVGGSTTVEGAAPIPVTAGSTVQDQDVDLVAGASISGSITSASGPVQGAYVYAYVPNEWGSYNSVGYAYSDESGAFMLRGLPAGTYRIQVSPPGGSDLISTWVGGDDFESATAFTVELGDSINVGDVELAQGGKIDGVITGDGQGIAGVWVYASRVRPDGSQEWLTSDDSDSTGAFVLSNLPAGPIRIQASVNTYDAPSPYLSTWYDGKQSFEEATSIDVVAGQTTTIEFPLLKGAQVTGTVVAGSPATPVEDATVEVCSSSWYWDCQRATTAADGSYTVIGLRAAQYFVHVMPPVGSNILAAYVGGTDQYSATKFNLSAGQLVTVDATLPLGAEIGGRALDSDGQPVEDATVKLYRTSLSGTSWADSVQTTTLADGSYVVHGLKPGLYRIRVVPSADSTLAVGWYGGGTTWGTAGEISVAAGEESSGNDVVLEQGATLSGRVLGGPDVVVGDVDVEVYLPSDNGGYEMVKYATSGSDGAYSIKGLAPGAYRIRAVPDWSSPWLSTWLGGDSFSAATPITLSGDDRVVDVTVPRGGEISGTITEAGTGNPVSDVSVRLCRQYEYYGSDEDCWDYEASAWTDQDGNYAFSRLDRGDYKVSAGDDWDEQSPWLEAWFGGVDVVTATRLTVAPGAVFDGVDISLVKGGSISGTLKAGDPALPVSDGYVTAYQARNGEYDYARSAQASNGVFSIEGLLPGMYVLRANSYDGEWISTWFGGTSQETAQQITVLAGQDASGNDIVLQSSASVSGTVVDSDGQPVSGGYVGVCEKDPDYDYGPDDYDYCDWYESSIISDGSFRVTGIPPGEYWVRAYPNSASDLLPAWYGGTTPSTLTLSYGSVVEDVAITMPAAARISGTITGAPAAGEATGPAAGVFVRLYRAGEQYPTAGQYTDATGTYTFGQLPAGTYHVSVSPRSSTPWLSEWFNDATVRASATPIEVTDGQLLTGQDVELALGGTISGAVTGGGAPVPYVSVTVYWADSGESIRSVTAGADGTYSIGGLRAGDYLVRFSPTGMSGNWLREWNSDRATKLTADPVSVTLGAVSTVDAQLDRGAAISGAVVGSANEPVDDVAIDVYDGLTGDYVTGIYTDLAGKYVVDGLRPGTYTLHAYPYGGQGYGSQWFSGRATRDLADTITVDVGQDGVADFSLIAGGSISGTVSGPTGPAANVYVTACSDEDEYGGCESAQTGINGEYRLSGLTEGRYWVRFGNYDGTLAREYYDDAATVETATLVAVQAGSSVEGIDATLAARGRLLGTMTDDLGDGVDGWVVACPVDPAMEHDCGYASATRFGNWAMTLDPGEYRFRFSAYGYDTQWYANATRESDGEVIEVSSGSEQRLDAELVPSSVAEGGSVTLAVTGDSGSGVVPVAGVWVELIDAVTGYYEYGEMTGADGTVTFSSVSSGSYRVWVYSYQDWITRFVGGDGSQEQATVFDVVTGESTDAGTVQLVHTRSISGLVTSGGEPLGYGRLRAYTLSGEYVASGYTDYPGTYRIPGLAPGKYYVFVDASQAPGNLASQWIGGGASPSTAQVIDVTDVVEATDVDVDLVGASRIAGTVRDADGGRWLQGILVELYASDPDGGELVETDFTDDEGGYSFGHLPSGEYKVRAGGLDLACEPEILGCVTPAPSAEVPAWLPVWFDGQDTYASATAVALAQGQRILDADVSLPKAATTFRVSIAGPSVVTESTSVALSGTTVGLPADGVVVVQAKSGDVWSDVTTAVLSGSSWSASVTAPGPGTATYRAVLRQGADELAVSTEKVVTVVAAPTVPGRPGTPTLVGLGDAQVSLAWTAASEGGSAITGYTVTAAPGGATCTVAELSCTVKGLTNGTAYTFSVVATNALGTGPASTPSAAFTPRTVPGAPGQPLAVAGTDGRVAVYWSAPASTGGASIFGYTVTATPGGATCASSGLTCTVVGLTNGTDYTFTVHAANVAGAGSESVPSAAVSPVASAPDSGMISGTVRIGSTAVGADEVWISVWSSAQSVVATTDASGDYSLAGLAPGQYTLQVTPLQDGISGFTGPVTVTAGQTTLKDIDLSVIPPAVPPPASVTLTDVAGNDLPTDSAEIPRVTRATPTVLFEVDACASATSAEYTADDWFDGTTSGLMTESPAGSGLYSAQVDISHLSGEVRFTATIACAGEPAEEVAFDLYIDPSGIVVDQHGNLIQGATATLVRSDSATGPFVVVPDGNAIMSERNRVNPVVTEKDGAFSWDVIKGFYKVLVTAPGCDDGSTEVLEIPPPRLDLVVTLQCGVPGAPGTPSAAAGDGQAAVTWTAPAVVGAALTGYTVTASPGGRTCTTSTLSCPVTGLTNGTSYTFTVKAASAAGAGPASAASNAVTPFGVPGAPGGLSATAGNAVVSLKWSAPADTGGSAITGYRVVVQPGGRTVASSGTSVSVTGLTNGTSYSFTVAAQNARGWGSASAAVTAKPVAPAPPPSEPPPSEPPATTDSDGDGVVDAQDRCPTSAGPASNGGCALPAPPPTVSVAVKAVDRRNKLYVDVDPNKGSGYWKFKVQKRTSSGSWKTLRTTYKTSGKKETFTVDLKKGKYRVKVKARYGYQGNTSAMVRLKR